MDFVWLDVAIFDIYIIVSKHEIKIEKKSSTSDFS